MFMRLRGQVYASQQNDVIGIQNANLRRHTERLVKDLLDSFKLQINVCLQLSVLEWILHVFLLSLI